MKQNALRILETFGQSIWLDYIRRDLITSGKLQQLIDEDGLAGITSNPSIFEKAIVESDDYKQDIQKMKQKNKKVDFIYDTLSQQDILSALTIFKNVYDNTNGRDGYVSLEVNPHLAYDTNGTIEEARRLWKALDRPNALIKVPGTMEGVSAITQLISEGINVNVTLLFGLPRYKEVAEAYILGLEMRAADNKPLDHITSIASFFLSRIDTLLDPQLELIIKENSEKTTNNKGVLATNILGKVAIASAKMAYQMYKEIFKGDRFKSLVAKGASSQKLLWASTSTKNPNYSDIMYVEELIGPDTINTIPMETLEKYLAHGNPKNRLESSVSNAEDVFKNLEKLGIDIDEVTQQLEKDGVEKFIQSFDKLLKSLEGKLA